MFRDYSLWHSTKEWQQTTLDRYLTWMQRVANAVRKRRREAAWIINCGLWYEGIGVYDMHMEEYKLCTDWLERYERGDFTNG